MIIGLSGMTVDPQGNKGSANSGKDTVADHLVAKHGFVKVALADPLKRFLMEVFEFTEEQLWGPSEKRNEPDNRYPAGGQFTKDVARGMKIPVEFSAECLTPRQALQTLGTGWGRSCYSDVWADYAMRVAKKILTPFEPNHEIVKEGYHCYTQTEGFNNTFDIKKPSGVVIPDLRYPNENNAIVSSSEAGVRVRVKRPVSEVLKGDAGTHTSETSLKDMHDDGWDYIIENTLSENALLMMVDQMMAVLSGRIVPYDDSQKDTPPFKRK